MSICSYIYTNFLNPVQSLPFQWYYFLRKKYDSLNSVKRNSHIVISLTSFPPRLGTLHYTLKSILNQTMKPDLLLLYLSKEEMHDESGLPSSILDLKKYGLQIIFVDDNLKPHKKYYYAMKHYPDSLIITIDDDVIYDKKLIADLYKSFLKYPSAVSSRRVHKIACDKSKNLLPYNSWHYEYKKESEPSHKLVSTGIGGVLYPPGLLPSETFDAAKIKELCLNADDIWLKFMELKNNVPVVWVKSKRVHPLSIKKAQKNSLQKNNYHENQNDKYIIALQEYYGIRLASKQQE